MPEIGTSGSWLLTGRGRAFRAHVVAYADDFVILSRGYAGEALMWTKAVMTRLGLILNEAILSLCCCGFAVSGLLWFFQL